ncbi:hypothetical protein [Mucilaginibacter pedocola]|nr:hypothetical protein [Mucilaginibacter pedocola]
MKYLFLFIFLCFVACKQPAQTKTNIKLSSKAIAPKHSGYGQTVLNNYQKFIAGLDVTDMASATIAAKKYTELFKGENQATRDTAYFLIADNFINKLNVVVDSLNYVNGMSADSLLADTSQIDTVPTPKLSASLLSYGKRLRENGFYVYISEGDSYIGRDYEFSIKWFAPLLSPVLRQYITQLNKDEKEGFQEDAGLTISPGQLVDRTVWWEKFAMQHPHSLIYKAAEENRAAYLSTLLIGMDNTRAADDYETGGLTDYFKEAWAYLQQHYANSQTNKLASTYFRLLQNRQKVKADALLKEYEKKKLI